MPRKPSRPAPLSLGSYTVRALGSGPDVDGRWLWRIEWYPTGARGAQRTQGMGRHRPEGIEAEAHRLIPALGGAPTVRRGGVTTWGILLRAWLAAIEREAVNAGTPQPSTLRLYRNAVAYLLHPAEAWPTPTGARALTAQGVELRDRLLGRGTADGLAASTTRVALRVAAMAWGWGVREEHVAPLPWQTPALKVPRTDRHIPTIAEGRRVADALQAQCNARDVRHRPPFDWPVVAYLLHWETGPRIGELAALTVDDLVLDTPAVWYGRHPGASKTGERLALIDDGTAGVLRGYVAERGDLTPDVPLWPVSETTARTGFWTTWVAPAMAEAGVPFWPPHAVRASLTDHLADARIDVVSADAQLGNREGTRDAYYRRALTAPLRAALAERALIPPDGTIPFRRPRGS